MTPAEAIANGYTYLAEYPGLAIPITTSELIQWTALLDMAGKKRAGRFHPPMEWMVHASLIRTNGAAIDEGYLGNGHHFRRMCDFFFNVPGSIFEVEWNPNTVRIIDEFFANQFLVLMGCGNSSKSFSMAIIGSGMFMVNPRYTKVLVTCTTVQAGEGKIWGDLSLAWNQIESVFAAWGLKIPGKLMTAPPMVRYQHPEYDPVKGWRYSFTSHKAGLELISTLQSSEKQTVANVQGYKNDMVIFLGDEWDTFSRGLVETVTGNLRGNNKSRCIASFNPSGRFTAGGEIATPEGGWDSVTPDDHEWDGKHGKVLRFDAEKSPNVLEGYKRWKGLPTMEYVEEQKENYGEDSIGWWMYVKAWFPPTGEAKFIYSETELIMQYHADHKVTTWLHTPTRIGGADPSFVFGGDAAVMAVLNIGPAQVNGATQIVCELEKVIDLEKFLNIRGISKDEQVVTLIKRFMGEYGIEVKNMAIDVTGATSFGTLVNQQIGPGWMPVISGSKPTDRPVSKADTRKGIDVFDNLLSEMWISPKALVRGGQIKGLDADTIKEMCSRCYLERNDRGKTEVESKKLMRKRNKKMSPNRADALFIGIHVARTKHGLVSTEKQGGLGKPRGPLSPMQKFYEDNPALKPKVPKWRKRQAFVPLKTPGHVPW